MNQRPSGLALTTEKQRRTKGQSRRFADGLGRQKAVSNVRRRVGDARVDRAPQLLGRPARRTLAIQPFVHTSSNHFSNFELLSFS